jgi:hypothetical protein
VETKREEKEKKEKSEFYATKWLSIISIDDVVSRGE